MKIRGWLIAWAVLLAACVTEGFYTQSTFTNVASHWDQALQSKYEYSTSSGINDGKNTSYDTLAKKSQLIVRCSFTGKRRMQNACYLSEVKVLQVYKGDPKISGQTIRVYEEVDTQYQKTYFTSSGGKLTLNYNKPPYPIESNCTRTLSQSLGHYTMLKSGPQYVLFLNPKPAPPKAASPKRPQNYVLLDSSFSKLTLDTGTTAESYKKPSLSLTLKDSFHYEILLQGNTSIQLYFQTKQAVLSRLNLK